MRHLGKLVRMGTQVVFLTATLRPRHEEKFCQSMNIIGPGVFKIREATTRPNIRYQIQTYKRIGGGKADDSAIRAVVELVEQLKIKYAAPAKIIVYSQEIKEAEKLSEALGCMLYHATVDDRSGKDKRLSEWKSGNEESWVAVASNALGLGVDTGDTRAVVHAGMPRDLANYVQESGRAGRDGLPSEAIVLLPEESAKRRNGINSRELMEARPVVYRHKKETGDREEEEMAGEVEDYIRSRCRRVVIDRVMDDNLQRKGCVKGEEWCDLCQHSKARDSIEDKASEDSPEEGPGFVSPEEMAFNRQDRERNWIGFHMQQKEKQEVYEVEELERELERFSKRCVYCYVSTYTSTNHSIGQCTAPGVEGVRKGVQEFTTFVQQKRSMERFSCCFCCYIPQAICEHWKHKEDKEERGRWEEDNSQECQYPDVIVPAFWSMMMIRGQVALDWLYDWAERDGYDIRDDTESERQWLGKKVEWGGIEGNNLIRAFKELASQHLDEES
jgi:superfamily II DNA helicase RecQ